MTEFRLTQISDTHLARRYQTLTDNFHRVSEHIDATRPDLVVNTGDLAFDAPTNADDLEFARTLHARFPSTAAICPAITTSATIRPRDRPAPPQPATEERRKTFLSLIGEDRWRFEAAGWCFIGLNSLIMNTGLDSEAEQFDWLASRAGSRQWQAGRAVPAQAALPARRRRIPNRRRRRSAMSRSRHVAG